VNLWWLYLLPSPWVGSNPLMVQHCNGDGCRDCQHLPGSFALSPPYQTTASRLWLTHAPLEALVPLAPPTQQPTPTSTLPPRPLHVGPHLHHEMQCACGILAQFDIYVDNYLGLVQGDTNHCSRFHCVLLHTVDQSFCPLTLRTPPSARSLSLSRSFLREMVAGKLGKPF
jgi:hypothetical protein